jgi:hypothetical protein
MQAGLTYEQKSEAEYPCCLSWFLPVLLVLLVAGFFQYLHLVSSQAGNDQPASEIRQSLEK